jgi:pyruvate/2-oxoglutarate/acetoin dehydrogenase E1 component
MKNKRSDSMMNSETRYVEAINHSLHTLLRNDKRVHLIGEDILDPYGGAFKVSRGLSSKFPAQVITTPISESGITGVGIGLAMRGMLPIVEIMFGDFLTLCVDQIVNHASKFYWMYNGQVDVPLVIRTPMGGGRGYGPTHSQTLEAMFLGVPTLKIIAPSNFHDPGAILEHSVLNEKNIVLFIENKLLYPSKLLKHDSTGESLHWQIGIIKETDAAYPTMTVDIGSDVESDPDIVLICYGGVAPIALETSQYLYKEEEIRVKLVIPSLIKPIPKMDLLQALEQGGKVLIVEEGVVSGGWGAEVSSQLHEALFNRLSLPVQRLGAAETPIPTAKQLEAQVLPGRNNIIEKIFWMMEQ